MGPYQQAIKRHADRAIRGVLQPEYGITLNTLNGMMFPVPNDPATFVLEVVDGRRIVVRRDTSFVVAYDADTIGLED